VLGRDGFRVGTGNAEGFVKRVERLVLPGQLKSEIAPLSGARPCTVLYYPGLLK